MIARKVIKIKEYIINNMDIIISVITIAVTWILGYLAKKNPLFRKNMIPIQNRVTAGIRIIDARDINASIEIM